MNIRFIVFNILYFVIVHSIILDFAALNANEITISNSQKAEFIQNFSDQISVECRDRVDEVITLEGVKVLCVSGPIRATNRKNEPQRFFSIAYLNSPGGEIRQSWRLGEEIYKNGAFGVVDQNCHSSCGTYLLPSLKRVFINEGTVMSMHTNLPRTPLEYMRSRRGGGLTGLLSGGEQAEIRESFLELLGEFDNFHRDFVVRELEFFRRINTDPSYTFRYREIYRTLSNRTNYACKPTSGMHLIIGPRYLSEFHVKVSQGWFPEDVSDYVEMLGNVPDTDTLIFDFDDHPFWTPDRGLVNSQICTEDQ